MTDPARNWPQSTAQDAQDAATDVAADGKRAAVEVAQTGKQGATDVVQQTKKEATNLMAQTRNEIRDQAEQQRASTVSSLRSIVDQLTSMTKNTDEDGSAVELAARARDRVHTAADWLDQRDVSQIGDELRRMGRQRPGAFLLTAAVAGVVAGRLTRGVVAEHSEDSTGKATPSTTREMAPSTHFTSASAPTRSNLPASNSIGHEAQGVELADRQAATGGRHASQGAPGAGISGE